jgi:hypothetical protein
MKMISWKYWHAPRLHLLKASVVVAYQLYTDCWDWCKEQRGTQWEQKQPLDFTKFQQKLGMQMCKFNPRTSSLPAAAKFRQVTRMTERDQEKNKRKMSEADQRMYKQVLSKKRLCGDLMDYHSHWQSRTSLNNKTKCIVCGEKCYTKCGICGIAVHTGTKENPKTKEMPTCFIDWHNDAWLGLCKRDLYDNMGDMYNTPFKKPTPSQVEKNRKHVEKIKETMSAKSSSNSD